MTRYLFVVLLLGLGIAAVRAQTLTNDFPDMINACEDTIPEVCALWVFRDTDDARDYMADWNNGAKSTIEILRFDNGAILLQGFSDRNDDPVTYFGKLAKDHVADGTFARTVDGTMHTGHWTGKFSTPVDLPARSRPLAECLADCRTEEASEADRNKNILVRRDLECEDDRQQGGTFLGGMLCSYNEDNQSRIGAKNRLCREYSAK